MGMRFDGIQYRCRTWLVAVSFCLLSCLLPQPASSQTAKAEEYEVKAAFLLNFAKFVRWPETNNEIRICVLGDDPFGAVLDRMAGGMIIEGRPILLERMQQPHGARRCHIVFLSPSLRDKTQVALDSLRGGSILTVGETSDFTRVGGIIRMVLAGSRVQFQINVDAAERAKLNISAKLLSLSQIVHDADKKDGGG